MRENPYEYVPQDLFFSKSLLGKTCEACHGVFPYNHFNKDSSIRDGHSLLCRKCLSTPKESTEEAVARLKESNLNSAAIISQRRPDELDYLERDPIGHSLFHTEFIKKLRKLLGPKLIVAPAFFLNELSLYVEDSKYPEGARYIGYIETDGRMNEFSEYDYNEFGVVTGESRRGYRGVLRKLIMEGYITEHECTKVFGACDEAVWVKALYSWRNKQH